MAQGLWSLDEAILVQSLKTAIVYSRTDRMLEMEKNL